MTTKNHYPRPHHGQSLYKPPPRSNSIPPPPRRDNSNDRPASSDSGSFRETSPIRTSSIPPPPRQYRNTGTSHVNAKKPEVGQEAFPYSSDVSNSRASQPPLRPPSFSSGDSSVNGSYGENPSAPPRRPASLSFEEVNSRNTSQEPPPRPSSHFSGSKVSTDKVLSVIDPPSRPPSYAGAKTSPNSAAAPPPRPSPVLRSTQAESERSRSSFDEPPRRPATYEENEKDVDEDIINMKDVRIMMKVTQCSMEDAINRLQKAKGNLELAIDLVYSESSTLDNHAEESPNAKPMDLDVFSKIT